MKKPIYILIFYVLFTAVFMSHSLCLAKSELSEFNGIWVLGSCSEPDATIYRVEGGPQRFALEREGDY